MSSPDVIVVGGGLAGLSASVALADSGFRVSLFEKSPRLGGRATSYVLPSGESIDNCQHVTLGCCTNLEDFYRRIGVADKIRYYDRLVFAGSNGDRAEIVPSRLPPPLHLAPSFARFPLLNWKDKRAIARTVFRIVTAGGRLRLSNGITMLEWLKRQNQTQQAIDRFWHTVLVSALNEALGRMDAAHGIAVFWKAFLSNPRGFVVGIPSVPLSELYALGGKNIEVRTRSGVAEIRIARGEVNGVHLDDGSEVTADYYIGATTFDRLLKMLPAGVRDDEGFANLARLHVSPITSVHFWFDRPVMPEPFLALMDRTIQWVFNKTKLCAGDSSQPGQYLQAVISASHALTERSQQEIIDLCRSELAELVPATAGAELTRSVVIRENAATFSPQPGSDRWRPAQRTPIRNFFLAGDWTQTGWPATMESAVRSGYLAAEEILSMEGRSARLVKPELPATGLARWFAK
jgi:zeta-carotene desaturase